MSNFFLPSKAALRARTLARYFSTKKQKNLRVAGYVNFYHEIENFGFVVPDDDPEKEYHFTSADLHADTIPKVRTYQKVEFSCVETGYGRSFARDVSAPFGRTLQYRHENLRLPVDKRNLRLSDLPDDQRFTGVVTFVSEDEQHGYIVPDKVGYNQLIFYARDLQCTGMKRIRRMSEVEFKVRKQGTRGADNAMEITRAGGELITRENKQLGITRRLLGGKYSARDKIADIPEDFLKAPRKTGYISEYDVDKLCGYICPSYDPFTRVFFHIDQLHMFGNREPRIYESVEFNAQDNPGKPFQYAVHITGPGQTVITSHHDNASQGSSKRNRTVDVEENTMYSGVIARIFKDQVNQGFWGFITPDEIGYRDVYFNRIPMQVTDYKATPQINTKVCFRAHQGKNGVEVSYLAGFGDVPFTSSRGNIADFYRGHGVKLHDNNRAVPISEDKVEGFVVRYNVKNGTGLLEATNLDGRHERIIFQSDDIEGRPGMIPAGCHLSFTVTENDLLRVGEEVKMYQRRATTISSVGRENFDSEVRFAIWRDLTPKQEN